MRAPELNSERLVLRPHRVSDFDALAALWSTPEVVRFIGGKPFGREEVWAKLLRTIGHWPALAYGYWVVASRDGGFLGEVGFADLHRDITPSFDGVPEMGWVLAPHAHGRGLGTEAVAAALTWADAEFSKKRTVCMINDDNLASQRIATKLGYLPWCKTKYHGEPVGLFERIAP